MSPIFGLVVLTIAAALAGVIACLPALRLRGQALKVLVMVGATVSHIVVVLAWALTYRLIEADIYNLALLSSLLGYVGIVFAYWLGVRSPRGPENGGKAAGR